MIRSFGGKAPNASKVSSAPVQRATLGKLAALQPIRLAKRFGTSEEYWMNLQSNYELGIERRSLKDTVAAIIPLNGA